MTIHTDDLTNIEREKFNSWFGEEFDKSMEEREANHTPSLSIIATKGTLDMAYPPLILASTASALGWDVSVFFTFYGLEILKKDLKLGISPLGNPAMPMKMPFGPDWFRNVNWNMPNTVMSNIPGFESMTTSMMKSTISQKGVASIEELRNLALEGGVKLVACQMSVDLFGFDQNEFIPEVSDWIGAASYLSMAVEADVSLFV